MTKIPSGLPAALLAMAALAEPPNPPRRQSANPYHWANPPTSAKSKRRRNGKIAAQSRKRNRRKV